MNVDLKRWFPANSCPFSPGGTANHQNTFQSCLLFSYISFENEFIYVSSCPSWKNLDLINNSLRIGSREVERKKEVFKLKIIFLQSMRGDQKNWIYLLKNCVFILTCLNPSHLQSILHLMQYTYPGVFSTAQNSFWTCQFWCLLVLLLFFVLPLPHGQMFPFEDFFHLEMGGD